ncbi:hypothetical protein PTKIN_Ptkin16aG0068200 [Pterospermum kingtungense]
MSSSDTPVKTIILIQNNTGVDAKKKPAIRIGLAKDNPQKRFQMEGLAYTKILNPGEKIDWDDIKKRLGQSSNTSSATVDTYSSNAAIDATGGSPTFMAQLKG